TATAPANSVAEPELNWRELARWIEKDDRTRPARPLPSAARNPFHEVVVQSRTTELKQESAPVEKINPESLGLVLTGTLVGPQRSVATINGRAYVVEARTSGTAGLELS